MARTFHLDEKNIKKIENIAKNLSDSELRVFSELQSIQKNISTQPKEMQESLSNYFIIKVISMIETYCKDKVERLIDKQGLEYDELKLSISLPDLNKIKKSGDITPGKIVTSELNFQDPKVINMVFSQLLQIDFFSAIKKEASYMENWQKEYRELLDLRNKIVHENYNVGILNRGQLFSYMVIYMNFGIASLGIFIKRLEKLKGKKM